MRDFRTVRIAAALLATCILNISACTRSQNTPAMPGNPAPPFTLQDLDGRTVRLADQAGKIVILDFWATWCGPCKKASRELEILHRKYRQRGVVVIGVNVDTASDAAAAIRAFVRDQGISYLLLRDDGTVQQAYGVTHIPTTIILDRTQIIRRRYPGYRPGIGRDISRSIEKLL